MNHIDLLQVRRFDKKIRYGSNGDGGYVIAELDGTYDCYISAGISNEESFSRDFICRYPLSVTDCYGFDGTIQEYPTQYTQNIQFIQKNISNVNDAAHTNLEDLMKKYRHIFLKMDIEGGEYPWLLHTTEDQLNSFKQIAIEFHGITNDEWNATYWDKMKCLEKLSKTHYLVHAHGNNYARVVNYIPDVIELTYVNKNYFVPPLNTCSLPIRNLDFPNHPMIHDIPLNYYPFTS